MKRDNIQERPRQGIKSTLQTQILKKIPGGPRNILTQIFDPLKKLTSVFADVFKVL